jgi:hypothetical protein
MNTSSEHESATQAVRDALCVIASAPGASDDDVVNSLKLLGYAHLSAEKLNAFVPSAFSWVLLRRMGVASFPSHYIALNEHGEEVIVKVANEHYFTAALALAFETLENGWNDGLSREQFEAVISRSPEMDAANKALIAGDSLSGASIQPLRVFRFLAEASDG